jgi:hypothetical protein
MHLTKITQRIAQTFQPSWQRQRSSKELHSFIERLHTRVDTVDLEVA